jgi:murein L,D-transpeptidase YafK
LVVQTRAHRLWLCESGHARSHFTVSLGSAGTGKRLEGDRKTPLGTYPLGTPRASAQYGWFIPVGYPTPEESARGLTGGDIGVHGPRRERRWLGRLNGWADWTRGCIALPTDGDLAAVTQFAVEHPRAPIRIE